MTGFGSSNEHALISEGKNYTDPKYFIVSIVRVPEHMPAGIWMVKRNDCKQCVVKHLKAVVN